MTSYIFDVDGTLTPSRGKMDKEFATWFKQFAIDHNVFMVTGSDRDKTLDQIPEEIYNSCVRVYQCAGCDVWRQDVNIKSGILHLPEELVNQLNMFVEQSKFYRKTGHHIDRRPGLVNFSIVGRGCNFEERVMYREWDEHKKERETVASKLRAMYPGFQFSVAGETGIDITIQGVNKSQILDDFDGEEEIFFFGDKCQPGGNDYEIAWAVDARPWGRVIEVESWKDTWDNLELLE